MCVRVHACMLVHACVCMVCECVRVGVGGGCVRAPGGMQIVHGCAAGREVLAAEPCDPPDQFPSWHGRQPREDELSPP